MKRTLSLLTSLIAFAMLSTAAQADPIGGPNSNCATCQGATYTLFSDFIDLNADPALETFRVSLFIDTSTLNIPGATAIDAVAIKITNQPDLVDASLFFAPTNSSGWPTLINSTVNAGGCSATGGGGFVCAQTTTDPAELTGSPLEWIFDVTLTAGGLIDPASIKIRYVNATGDKVGDLVSENIELQPSPCPPTGGLACNPPFLIVEPTSLALLGIALLVGGAVNRRRLIS